MDAAQDGTSSDREHVVTHTIATVVGTESDSMPMYMPASVEQAREDIRDIGVEGTPADAKVGPGMLLVELALIPLIVAVAAIAMGL